MSGRQRRRGHGDRGQVGGIEVLPLGFMIFVSGILLFTSVWGIVDAHFAVAAAAREGTRAFVEAPTITAAHEEAAARAAATLVGRGRGGDRAEIQAPRLVGAYGRCVRVSMTVSYRVRIVTVPFLGGLGPLRPVSSTHSEVVDPFRAGIPGPIAC